MRFFAFGALSVNVYEYVYDGESAILLGIWCSVCLIGSAKSLV